MSGGWLRPRPLPHQAPPPQHPPPPTGTHDVTEDSRPRLIGQSGCLEDVQRALGLQLANQGRQSAEGAGRGSAHPVEAQDQQSDQKKKKRTQRNRCGRQQPISSRQRPISSRGRRWRPDSPVVHHCGAVLGGAVLPHQLHQLQTAAGCAVRVRPAGGHVAPHLQDKIILQAVGAESS